MTGEQKSLLIYGARYSSALHLLWVLSMRLLLTCCGVAGALATFFALFLAGYLLD
jgi:hypothetical protein